MAQPEWYTRLLQLREQKAISYKEAKEVLDAWCLGEVDDVRLEVMMEDPERAVSLVKLYYHMRWQERPARELRKLQNALQGLLNINKKEEEIARLKAKLQLNGPPAHDSQQNT